MPGICRTGIRRVTKNESGADRPDAGRVVWSPEASRAWMTNWTAPDSAAPTARTAGAVRSNVSSGAAAAVTECQPSDPTRVDTVTDAEQACPARAQTT